MSPMVIRFSLFILALLLIDTYVFQGVRTVTVNMGHLSRQIAIWGYWLISSLIILVLTYSVVMLNIHPESRQLLSKVIAFFILFLIPKLIFALFLLTEDIFRLLHAGWILILKTFSSTENSYFEGRRRFISQLGLTVASLPFFAILHGITKGKYNFKVLRETLYFDDLPEAFDGFTITQLSDIHSGSFDNKEAVERGVALANSQKSDLVVFTGDLVNNFSEEMIPYIDIFKTLQAPFGKFSILGNHDYGDYSKWPSPDDKKHNFESIQKAHQQIGFQLLMNENVQIKKNNEQISILGVENWGLPPFPQKGDLNKAAAGIKGNDFKILLSHDPSHWGSQVLKYQSHIHLTLSGHTHGMQFGIEVPGFKWSPVKYKYPRWAGLYTSTGKYLYVNRGFGFIGFPGRVGIWPEITVITLKKKKKAEVP